MEKLKLDLGEKSSFIYIGSGLLDHKELVQQYVTGNSVFIVTNDIIAPMYLDRMKSVFAGRQVDYHILPDGEALKSLESCGKIVENLLLGRHNRATTLVALGGGVVGDITGFVAATYQRGVDFIQVPTTLLAQVDSSVGGKTAVNHPLGKNMIGVFHQPKAVLIDTDLLKTLPPRELSAGLAEVIKHGALADQDYFAWIEKEMSSLLALKPGVMAKGIRRSCEIKAAIVASDEKEKGPRALLNLGHTFGHAIEQSLGYGNWLHGEAVGAGLVMAADLSHRLGRINIDAARRIKRLVRAAHLPVAPPPELDVDAFLTSMAVDKKATDQGIRFILLNAIGEAEIVSGVDSEVLKETLLAGDRLAE